MDSLSVVFGLLVDECLSMKVNTLKVFGRAHIDQVPAHKLFGVHPQALKAVYYSIDSYTNTTKDIKQYFLMDFSFISSSRFKLLQLNLQISVKTTTACVEVFMLKLYYL